MSDQCECRNEGACGDKKLTTRRNFLFFVGMGSLAASTFMLLGGLLRFLGLNVFYEASMKVKVGRPDDFADDSNTFLPESRIFLFRDKTGFSALSAVCPHLGCIVSRSEKGYVCPCHGSYFDATGKALSGPSPRALDWKQIALSADGYLVVDGAKDVDREARLRV